MPNLRRTFSYIAFKAGNLHFHSSLYTSNTNKIIKFTLLKANTMARDDCVYCNDGITPTG